MKISIITATYNSESTIRDTIKSVLCQTYRNIEYIIIDGLSKDRTLDIVREYESQFEGRMRIISEKDKGIYDALNKGVKYATGDAVGFIHADDILAKPTIIEQVAKEFEQQNCDLLYGDLLYVSEDNTKVIRNWKSCPYNKKLIKRGWMPAHPTLYVRKTIYDRVGGFDITFKISADYDFILRAFSSVDEKNVVYLQEIMVRMRVGGVSNNGIKNITIKMSEDLSALSKNNIKMGWWVLMHKNLSKIPQLIFE